MSQISWQRNLNLCGSPCSSSEPRRPLGVISICTRPGQHVIDGVGPYQPQVLGAEFGLGVRWRLASTSIGVPGPSFGSPPVGLVACQGRDPLPDSSEAHDGHRELGHSRTSTKQQLIYFQNKQQNEQSPKFTHRCKHNLKSPTTAGECVYSMPGSCSCLASSLVHHVLTYPTTRLATNLNCHSPRCVVR